MLYGTSYTVQATKAVIHSSSLIGSSPESIQALTNLPDVPTDFMFASIVGKMGYLMGHWSLCCTYGHRYQYTEPHKTQASLESCWGLVSLQCSFWDSSGTLTHQLGNYNKQDTRHLCHAAGMRCCHFASCLDSCWPSQRRNKNL